MLRKAQPMFRITMLKLDQDFTRDNLKMIREQSLEASMSQSEGGDRSRRDEFNTILESIKDE